MGIIWELLKENTEDIEMREEARRKGWNYYTSNTGLRDVKTNRKIMINSDSNMIDVKTHKNLGKAYNHTKYDDKTKYGKIFTGGICTAGDIIIVDLVKLAKKRGKKYYEFSIGEYIETETGRRVTMGFHDDKYEVLDYHTRQLIYLEEKTPWIYMTLTHFDWNHDNEIWEYFRERESPKGGEKIYWE